jgi:hypothetical protein
MNGRLAGCLSVARVRADLAALRAELILSMRRFGFVSSRRHSNGAEWGDRLFFCKQVFVAAFAATARSDATVLCK